MAKFLAQLSQLAALPHYLTKIVLGQSDGALMRAPETTKQGALIGYRSGYLVAVGFVRIGWAKALGVVIRFPAVADPEAVKNAVSHAPSLKKLGLTGAVGPQILAYRLPWRFGYKPEKVLAIIDSLLAVVGQFAGTWKPQVCEDCGQTADIVLVNRIPATLCSRCQSNVVRQQHEKKEAYASVETDYMAGFLFGVGGVIMYAMLWGVGGYWFDQAVNGIPLKLLAAVPLLAAIVVPKLYSGGAKKITPAGVGITVVLTAAAVITGDALFFSLHVMRSYSWPLWHSFKVVLLHLWQIKTASGAEWLVTGMGVVAILASAQVAWQLRPKFKADVQPLQRPAFASGD